MASAYFFLRTMPDGRREISWRVWVLVWVVPVLFLAAVVLSVVWEGYRLMATVPGEGEVVRVYAWPGETPFDRDVINYSPVFRYRASDDLMTEASTGASHPDWNFDIGSRHAIRFFSGSKGNVVFPGPHNWFVAYVIGIIGIIAAVPAVLASLALRRWQARARSA